ncbi:MAG: ABC transporter permease [Ancrocorticia sp.]|uniref:ABC transporter permease n=1 Tax=Ancrocorticia sp. TaxID=2593684 RepID=UPI003F8E6E65
MSEKTTPKPPRASFGQWIKAVWHVGLRSNWLVYVLAVVIALLVGAVLIVIAGANVGEAYSAMFRGAIFNYQARSTAGMFAPLTATILAASPLIIAGLGLALGFRAGLFNIGGNGQIMMGAIAAAYFGFTFTMPPVIHMLVCIVAAILAGAIYAGIVGVLKARTGASEVILTIMFNSIALLFLRHLLTLKTFQQEGSANPRTDTIEDNAQLPDLLPSPFQLNLGIVIAILAAIFVWWYLERSTWGFELRAVGANPDAARTAGMNIGKVTAITMALSGALTGLAGGVQLTGTIKYLDAGIAGSLGFDAITVALLGRNSPIGTVFAGLLFGAFKAGGRIMQVDASVPIDMVLILQSVIVLLIAAPPFVRWLFHLPKREHMTIRKYLTLQAEKEVAA